MNTIFLSKDEFWKQHASSMNVSVYVYDRMIQNGFKDDALAAFDLTFISDKKEKLDALSSFLSENYSYKLSTPQQTDGHWMAEGRTIAYSFNVHNIIYWAIDLHCKASEFDCMLTDYRALPVAHKLKYPLTENKTVEDFYNQGIDAIAIKNFGAAMISFTTGIGLDPAHSASWHARGYCKEEIFAWAAARSDYEKALSIDPENTAALLSLATNKDDAGEHEAALIHYDTLIEMDPDNAMAYFNRGNTLFSLGNKPGACQSWEKARSLGSPYAKERLDEECR